MIPALLMANWKRVFAGAAILVVLGYLGNQQRIIARQGRQIERLTAEISRAVPAISKEDTEALLRGVAAVKRDLDGAREEIRKLEGRPGFIRETVRTGPPGPSGVPGAPGPPGLPLIPPGQEGQARERATERIVAFFDEGSLVGCQGPGLPPLTIELLRDPTGRLLSTAPCVWRINDEVFRDPVSSPPRQDLFSFDPYLAAGYLAGGVELGIGADMLHLGKLSLGADLRVARWEPGGGQSVSVGFYHLAATVSWPLAGSIRAQAGYAYPLRHDLPGGPFLGVSVRF